MKAIYVSVRDGGGQVKLARRSIGAVMSAPAVTVNVHCPLGEALTKMITAGLRHLVVVDERGRCAGVLSDRAVASAWATDYGALAKLTVAEVLDAVPATVDCRGVVVDAAVLMRHGGVDAVAVVDPEGTPVGIVTGSDLVALLAR